MRVKWRRRQLAVHGCNDNLFWRSVRPTRGMRRGGCQQIATKLQLLARQRIMHIWVFQISFFWILYAALVLVRSSVYQPYFHSIFLHFTLFEWSLSGEKLIFKIKYFGIFPFYSEPLASHSRPPVNIKRIKRAKERSSALLGKKCTQNCGLYESLQFEFVYSNLFI